MEQTTVQNAEQKQMPQINATGIPRQMKLEFEARSGLSFDDVRVHYNSDRPARVGALAYTQGTQVYLKPGEERHLGHELGHVIQQKQGRVRPTTSVAGQPVNDDPRLEREADAWAAASAPSNEPALQRREAPSGAGGVIQREGEEDAINATIAPQPLRRGNRRNSIIETGGRSRYILSEFRQWFKGFFQNEFLSQFPHQKNLRLFVYAEAVKQIEAANCGEFAAVTFTHLAQNTKGQWVYKCHMEPSIQNGGRFDHAFTLTSPWDFDLGPLPANADMDNTLVVDAWANYQLCTLKQFCAKQNPYSALLSPEENVYVDNKACADGEPKLDQDMKAFISTHITAFLNNHTVVPEQRNIRGVFDFPRLGRGVDDIRTDQGMAAHLSARVSESRRHRELDRMSVDRLRFMLPLLPPIQCNAYLLSLWQSGKLARMRDIMKDPQNVEWVMPFIDSLDQHSMPTQREVLNLLSNVESTTPDTV